jgi:WD40 repeat protein
VQVDNVFIYDLLLSLEGEKADEQLLSRMTLSEYLGNLEIPDPEPGSKAEVMVESEGVHPLVLIIDQFEEIFTNHLEHWEKRAGFFEQLAKAMEDDPYLWVVLTIREDYAAGLDRFAHLLPNQMRGRYYMQRMRQNAAMSAVVEPARKYNLPIDRKAAEEMVNNLRLIKASSLESGTRSADSLDEFVEPVQLQVVCFQLWQRAARKNIKKIDLAVLSDLLDEKDLPEFVSEALGDFYEDVIKDTVTMLRNLGQPISQRMLRDWFSNHLITPAGTRAFVFGSESEVEGLPIRAVKLLASRFIIRSESRASATWYELVHDRMVEPILKANEKWRNANTSQLENDAIAWLKAGKKSELLYKGRQLREAEKLLSSGELNQDEIEFIAAGDENRKKNRRLIGLGIFTAIALLFAAIGMGIFSVQAEQGKATAVAAQATAIEALSEVNTSATLVAFERNEAVKLKNSEAEARIAAEQAVDIAIESQNAAKLAAMEARIANEMMIDAENRSYISRLAAFVDYYSSTGENPQLGLLFSLAHKQVTNNVSWDTRKALSSALDYYYSNPFGVLLDEDYGFRINHTGGNQVLSLDFHPDGELLVFSSETGPIVLWDHLGEKEVELPKDFQSGYWTYALAFSQTKNFLASGDSNGAVRILDRDTNEVVLVERPNTRFSRITKLAFSPNSDYLAIGTINGYIHFYNIAEKTFAQSWREPSGSVWSMAWSPNGDQLAYGGISGQVTVRSFGKEQETYLFLMGVFNSYIDGLAWDKGGRYLYIGGQDRLLVKWDTIEDKIVRSSVRNETPPILSLALHRDGKVLITGNRNPKRPVTLWDAETLLPVGDYTFHRHWSRAVAFDPNGLYFASGSYDSSIVVAKIRSLDPLAKSYGQLVDGTFIDVAIDPRTEQPAFIKSSGISFRYDFQLLDSQLKPAGDLLQIKGIAAALGKRNGSLMLALNTMPGRVAFINPSSGIQVEPLLPLQSADRPVRAMALSPDGRILGVVTCGENSMETYKRNFTCPTREIAFYNLDVKPPERLSITDWETTVNLDVTALGISPNNMVVLGLRSGKLAFASLDRSVKVADPLNLEQAGNFLAPVSRIAFGPKGEIFAVAYEGKTTIKFWDSEAKRFYYQVEEAVGNPEWPNSVTGLAFYEKNGRLRMLSTSQQRMARDWDVDLESLAQRACALSGGDIQQSDWQDFFPNRDKPENLCP